VIGGLAVIALALLGATFVIRRRRSSEAGLSITPMVLSDPISTQGIIISAHEPDKMVLAPVRWSEERGICTPSGEFVHDPWLSLHKDLAGAYPRTTTTRNSSEMLSSTRRFGIPPDSQFKPSASSSDSAARPQHVRTEIEQLGTDWRGQGPLSEYDPPPTYFSGDNE
jgi:hypothetical protein